MGFRCGIVGLPNVGKSTLFNALTSTAAAEAANYPFCTIEPNIGKVAVPDARLAQLAEIATSKQLIPTYMEFVDIAGLVKGASKGEGLGNQFLSHIREVDAIIHVLRCFENDDITHVEGAVDPLRDKEIIETELMLADLTSLEGRLPNLQRKAVNDKSVRPQVTMIEEIIKYLSDGKSPRALVNAENRETLRLLQLLSTKPVLYVCNVSEDEVADHSKNPYVQKVIEQAAKEGHGSKVAVVSAQIEAEIANMGSEEDKQEFLTELGMQETGLANIIRKGYDMLDLITYFTVGPKEAHAWTIKKGTLAPQAAGVIHSDFEKGFIRAETISCQDYINFKGEAGARQQGKARLEGKDYQVQDGDIIHFRFNV
jgi:GTP-binding protein YchF